MMVTLKIVCENVSILQSVSVIIGSFPIEGDSEKEKIRFFKKRKEKTEENI